MLLYCIGSGYFVKSTSLTLCEINFSYTFALGPFQFFSMFSVHLSEQNLPTYQEKTEGKKKNFHFTQLMQEWFNIEAIIIG